MATKKIRTYLDSIKQGVYAYISSAIATVCLTDTWTKLAGTFTNEVLLDFAIISNALTYQGTETRRFEIKIAGTFESDEANTVLDLAVFKNGVLQENSLMQHELNSTVDVYNLVTFDVIELETDDYLELKIRADRDCDVTALTFNTSVQKFNT